MQRLGKKDRSLGIDLMRRKRLQRLDTTFLSGDFHAPDTLELIAKEVLPAFA